MRFNDRKAPRLGKKEFSTNIVDIELYKIWKKDNPQYGDISYSQYMKVWENITNVIDNTLITNPQGIKLPYTCGELVIQFLPKVVKAYNEIVTAEEVVRINYLNIATKGKIAKISWIRKYAARFNPPIMLFAHEPTRHLGKKLTKQLEINPEIFRNSKMNIYDNNK